MFRTQSPIPQIENEESEDSDLNEKRKTRNVTHKKQSSLNKDIEDVNLQNTSLSIPKDVGII